MPLSILWIRREAFRGAVTPLSIRREALRESVGGQERMGCSIE